MARVCPANDQLYGVVGARVCLASNLLYGHLSVHLKYCLQNIVCIGAVAEGAYT